MRCQVATPSSSQSLLAVNSFCSNLSKTTLTMHFVIICVQYELIKHVFFLSGLESGNENERPGGEFDFL